MAAKKKGAVANFSEFDDDEENMGDEGMARLSKLASRQAHAESEVVAAENELTRAKNELDDIESREFPQAMEDVGVTSFKSAAGLEISIVETLSCRIAVADRFKAHEWLNANGQGAIIKNMVQVVLGKGKREHGKAETIARNANKRNPGAASVVQKVEPQTLKATIKSLMAEGEDVPLGLFNVLKLKKTQIKGSAMRKKKKGGKAVRGKNEL